jgi:glycosyltransferase involved in cell wall biosynthesis
MMIDLVSIIVPVFNREKFLFPCLASLQKQTYPYIEVLIVDDCSTDLSYQIAIEFLESDERFKVFRNDTNRGVSFSRNFGIKQAKGKFIALMDSDDISFEERIAKQLDKFKKNVELAVVGTACLLNFQDGSEQIIKYPKTSSEINLKLLQDFPFCNSSLMFKKSCLYDLDYIYNKELKTAEDFELLVRLKLKGNKFENIQQILVKRNIHNESLTYSEFDKLEVVRKKIIAMQLLGLGDFRNHLVEYIYIFTYKSKPNTADLFAFMRNRFIFKHQKSNVEIIDLYGFERWNGLLSEIELKFMQQAKVKFGAIKQMYLSLVSLKNFVKHLIKANIYA